MLTCTALLLSSGIGCLRVGDSVTVEETNATQHIQHVA